MYIIIQVDRVPFHTQGYLLFVYYGLFINNAVVCMGWRGGEGEKFASCFTQRKRPFHDSN
jgi:hypothetical protein